MPAKAGKAVDAAPDPPDGKQRKPGKKGKRTCKDCGEQKPQAEFKNTYARCDKCRADGDARTNPAQPPTTASAPSEPDASSLPDAAPHDESQQASRKAKKPPQKRCTSCKTLKDRTAFSSYGSYGKDKLRDTCIKCENDKPKCAILAGKCFDCPTPSEQYPNPDECLLEPNPDLLDDRTMIAHLLHAIDEGTYEDQLATHFSPCFSNDHDLQEKFLPCLKWQDQRGKLWVEEGRADHMLKNRAISATLDQSLPTTYIPDEVLSWRKLSMEERQEVERVIKENPRRLTASYLDHESRKDNTVLVTSTHTPEASIDVCAPETPIKTVLELVFRLMSCAFSPQRRKEDPETAIQEYERGRDIAQQAGLEVYFWDVRPAFFAYRNEIRELLATINGASKDRKWWRENASKYTVKAGLLLNDWAHVANLRDPVSGDPLTSPAESKSWLQPRTKLAAYPALHIQTTATNVRLAQGLRFGMKTQLPKPQKDLIWLKDISGQNLVGPQCLRRMQGKSADKSAPKCELSLFVPSPLIPQYIKSIWNSTPTSSPTADALSMDVKVSAADAPTPIQKRKEQPTHTPHKGGARKRQEVGERSEEQSDLSDASDSTVPASRAAVHRNDVAFRVICQWLNIASQEQAPIENDQTDDQRLDHIASIIFDALKMDGNHLALSNLAEARSEWARMVKARCQIQMPHYAARYFTSCFALFRRAIAHKLEGYPIRLIVAALDQYNMTGQSLEKLWSLLQGVEWRDKSVVFDDFPSVKAAWRALTLPLLMDAALLFSGQRIVEWTAIQKAVWWYDLPGSFKDPESVGSLTTDSMTNCLKGLRALPCFKEKVHGRHDCKFHAHCSVSDIVLLALQEWGLKERRCVRFKLESEHTLTGAPKSKDLEGQLRYVFAATLKLDRDQLDANRDEYLRANIFGRQQLLNEYCRFSWSDKQCAVRPISFHLEHRWPEDGGDLRVKVRGQKESRELKQLNPIIVLPRINDDGLLILPLNDLRETEISVAKASDNRTKVWSHDKRVSGICDRFRDRGQVGFFCMHITQSYMPTLEEQHADSVVKDWAECIERLRSLCQHDLHPHDECS